MSIDKQKRLLSYKPTIIVATPGRLWELMTDHEDKYLMDKLPLIDVLVLDEADRMIADGHFKEMHDILGHIYTTRVSVKGRKDKAEDIKKFLAQDGEKLSQKYKSAIDDKEQFTTGNVKTKPGVDLSKVVDMYDEDAEIDMIGGNFEMEEERPTKLD
jgi:ATP-dependent RNA helicase DDX24/MAK5